MKKKKKQKARLSPYRGVGAKNLTPLKDGLRNFGGGTVEGVNPKEIPPQKIG